MTVYYLPIEIGKRELVGKMFLATRLAAMGHTALVFYYKLFDQTRWPSQGVYIGKNCFRTIQPYGLSHYQKMKRSGVDLWYLDEEAGICAGDNMQDWQDMLRVRLNPADLDSRDKILCWGNWQAETFRETKSAAPIIVSGSPNFDVMQTKYNPALSEFDAAQTGGLGDYILVNTRFAFSNGLFTLDDLAKQFSASEVESGKLLEWTATDGALKYLFVQLLQKLAEELPNKQFILRPHPVEKEEFYRALLTGHKNITISKESEVGAWIRRSSGLIQNGCTTAIQAKINGKPVYTYEPLSQPDTSSAGLPNKVGAKTTNISQMLAAISDGAQDMQQEIWGDTIAELDAIENIAAMAQQAQTNDEQPKTTEELHRTLANIAGRFARVDAAKRAILAAMPTRRRYYQIYADKLDQPLWQQADAIHNAANSHYQAETSIKTYGKYCYAVMPS